MRKGFTLIEMLIALVVIGLIISLLVGIFGNPLKDATIGRAAAKTMDDLRALGDAADHYYMKNVKAANSTAAFAGAEGALKVVPKPAKETGSDATAYVLDTTMNLWGDVAVNDTVVKLTKVSDDVCKKINKELGIGSTILGAASASYDMQCFGTAANDNTVIKVLFIDAVAA